MSSTSTPLLGLYKETPGTQEPADMSKYNANFDTLDNAMTLTGNQTGTNKTFTTPTIGNFTNATHNHQNAAGGGTLATAAFAANAVTQGGQGSSVSDVTTTSTAFQDTGISAALTTTGGNVLVVATFDGQNDTGGATWEAKIHYDADNSNVALCQSTQDTRTLTWLFSGVSAGAHTFGIQFKVTASGTARIIGARNGLQAIEFKK